MAAEFPGPSPEVRYRFTGTQYVPEYWNGQKPNDGTPQTEYPDYDNRTVSFARSTLRAFSDRASSSSTLATFREGSSLDGSLSVGSIVFLESEWRMDDKSLPDEVGVVFASSSWGVVCPTSKPNQYGEKVIIGFHEKRGVEGYKQLPIRERVFFDRPDVFPPAFKVGDIWRDVLAEGRDEEALRKLTKVEVHAIGKPRRVEKFLPRSVTTKLGFKPLWEGI
jgi:hypothetical protein